MLTILNYFRKIDLQSYKQNTNFNSQKTSYSHMRFEINRINSFKCKLWPYYYYSKKVLANDGFFLIKEDLVECAFCGGVLSAFKNGKSISHKHITLYPKCQFIKNKLTFNYLNKLNIISTQKTAMNGTGIQPDNGPIYLNLSSEISRKKTFNIDVWKLLNNLKIDKLVEAGFFSCGILDYVKCFYCNGFLYDWNNWDNPWKEHLKYFPDCGFLKSNYPKSLKNKFKKKRKPKSSKKNNEFKMCKICFDNDIGVVFLPCGHQFSCIKCASCISICSICRQVINGYVKTYFA